MNVIITIIFMVIILSNAEKYTKQDKELLQKVSTFLQTYPRASKYFESPEQRSERINNGLEKIVKLFNILGQVDNFITEKAKTLIKTLNAIYDIRTDDATDTVYNNFNSDY